MATTYRLSRAPSAGGSFEVTFNAANLGAAQTYGQAQATLIGVPLRLEYDSPTPGVGVVNQTFTPAGGEGIVLR